MNNKFYKIVSLIFLVNLVFAFAVMFELSKRVEYNANLYETLKVEERARFKIMSDKLLEFGVLVVEK
jgi:hypothetical protein